MNDPVTLTSEAQTGGSVEQRFPTLRLHNDTGPSEHLLTGRKETK